MSSLLIEGPAKISGEIVVGKRNGCRPEIVSVNCFSSPKSLGRISRNVREFSRRMLQSFTFSPETLKISPCPLPIPKTSRVTRSIFPCKTSTVARALTTASRSRIKNDSFSEIL
jgi:hypothetical protein